MHTKLQPGRYVIAVSGGVDSVALLDMLAKQANETAGGQGPVRLIVAHYDHGIRPDSHEDRLLVEQLARKYGLPFVYDAGYLGADASEARAREARYAFLRHVREQSGAQAIVTAHHEDDVLETAILNYLRGTHRRGMVALQSTDIIKRPLLHVPKERLMAYAQANGLSWREDSTNLDVRYKRNRIRHTVIARLTFEERKILLAQLKRLQAINRKIDHELANHLHVQPGADLLDRRYFIGLPFKISVELLAAWLRREGVLDYDRRSLARLTVAAKTYAPGRRIGVNGRCHIDVNQRSLALVKHDR